MSFDLPQTDFQISVWWAHCDDIRAGQRGAAHPRKNNRGPDYSPTGREQVRTPRRAFHWTGRRNNRDREAFGMTSLISSSCLEGNSSKKLDMPVIFAPGCTKLLTNPLSTGSLILIKTIGIVVAFFTAKWALQTAASDNHVSFSTHQLGCQFWNSNPLYRQRIAIRLKCSFPGI